MNKIKKIRILHIFNDPKFSNLFFDFLNTNGVESEKDFLFHYRCADKDCHHFGMPHVLSPSFFSVLPNIRLLPLLFRAEKILVHCLASPILLFYLALFPRLTQKTYWVIWGKDLYFYQTLEKKRIYHEIYEFFRKQVIRKIAHIITYTEGDYQLAQQWYGTNAKLHRSYMYPSNLYRNIPVIKKPAGTSIRILVGNSADPSNHHLEILKMLEKFKNDNVELITPLSYGDMAHAKKVIIAGQSMFGSKFAPLTELIPYNDYLTLLSKIDIGIFGHKRQQAMGNIITLLGAGKKVYLRKGITSWRLLREIGITLFDFDAFDLTQIDKTVAEKNTQIIKNTFSAENLLDQWNEIVKDIP